MTQQAERTRRIPLSRDRVLAAAVALADEVGIEALSMRRLAQELGVVPMALYKHVANKEELLDGMVDALVSEIDPPVRDAGWKNAVRLRVLSARGALLRHPWARQVLESRTNKTPAVLGYMDSFIGMFLAGGFSVDLTHHVMHALGSRMWGFTQELFDDPPAGRRRAGRHSAGGAGSHVPGDGRAVSEHPEGRHRRRARRRPWWARAAMTSSSSSSRSICSWTALSGFTGSTGPPLRHRPARTAVRHSLTPARP